MPQRIADKIARLIGAAASEVVVADSTSVNLYKVLSAALQIAGADAPARRVVLSERTNFPTDLYIADTLTRAARLPRCGSEDAPISTRRSTTTRPSSC